MEPQAADNPLDTRYRLRIQLIRIIVLLVSIILSSSLALFWPPSQSQARRKHPVPYHTSILSGAAWVAELLTGHPEQI